MVVAWIRLRQIIIIIIIIVIIIMIMKIIIITIMKCPRCRGLLSFGDTSGSKTSQC